VIGSSSGIGEACALHLASKGWDVFAGVRQPRDAERLRESASGSLSPVTLDVTDESSIDSALAEVSERTSGRLTAVLNNAGVAIGGPLEYLSLEEWRRQLEVNVIGPVAVTRACLPLIRRSGRGGRVVFIGSIGGRIATPLKNMQMQARNGVPPAHVADVVYNVLTATKPRARYLVGADAVAMATVSRLLPDVARDALVRIVTRS
jgi:NAD(P)-dependent dehydrogenase (short-subunit alcohol dehydrogenase family)